MGGSLRALTKSPRTHRARVSLASFSDVSEAKASDMPDLLRGTRHTRYALSAHHTTARTETSFVAMALVALASGAMIFSGVLALRIAAVLPVLIAVAVVVRRAKRPKVRGYVEWKDQTLVRQIGHERAELLDLREPFGVTVLANRRRTRLLLAFTRPQATRFVSVHLDDASESTRKALVELASTVPEGDALDVDGVDVGLAPDDALDLVRSLERSHPTSLAALYLSTSHGDPLVLEGTEMHLGERRFDLRAPLEWRPFVFTESAGAVTTLYQATWLRQRSDELVLVAPMPLDVIPRSASALGGTRSSELRILAQTSESPPPRELRVAIDRMFMLPLRRALDAAPAPKRSPTVPPSSQGKAQRSSAGDS